MEILALSIMIGTLGIMFREVMVTRQEEKRLRKEAAHKARFDAEMKRTNLAVIASFKK